MSEKMRYKLTLDSGKVVILKQYQVRHFRTAAEIAGNKAKQNQALMAIIMQDEILKQLLVSIDGKELSGSEKERIDDLFDPMDYRQVLKVIEELLGDANRPTVEMVTISQ